MNRKNFPNLFGDYIFIVLRRRYLQTATLRLHIFLPAKIARPYQVPDNIEKLNATDNTSTLKESFTAGGLNNFCLILTGIFIFNFKITICCEEHNFITTIPPLMPFEDMMDKNLQSVLQSVSNAYSSPLVFEQDIIH